MIKIIIEYTYLVPITGVSSIILDAGLLFGYFGGAYCMFYLAREWYRHSSVGL